mgnify:CR=1 FL=1
MRKKRIKKNFWFDDEENNLLKKLSELSGKKEAQVIRKLIRGADIKERPPKEFYEELNKLISLRKEIKAIRDTSRYTRELDTGKVKKVLDNIDLLREQIVNKFLK